MAEEVYEDIFRICVPLPHNPLKEINSYFIKGSDRDLLVDTAMNRPECRDVLDSELRSLEVDMERTDLLVTHMHADHLGLASHLKTENNKVLMHPLDIEIVSETEYWKKMLGFALKSGFPSVDPQEAIRKHPGYRYGPLGKFDIEPLVGGKTISVGKFDLELLHTAGHTKGHLCLLEREHGILLSGDHVLGDITPNISHWAGIGDPLGDYISSLHETIDLEVSLVLPGHREPFNDLEGRVLELIEHHEKRCREVLSILQGGPMNAFEVASSMSWDLTYKTFDEFPITQKWFALGEAIAHIRNLEVNDRISGSIEDGVIKYKKNP